MEKSFFFIAIIPPKEICDDIESFKQILSEQFDTHRSLRHIPHITLAPPFHIDKDFETKLKEILNDFSRGLKPFPINLEDFSTFKKHTLFVDVENSESLSALHSNLLELVNSEPKLLHKPVKYFQKFNPHVTIAYRDLEPNFKGAWSYFEKVKFTATFEFTSFALLKHNGEKWEVV